MAVDEYMLTTTDNPYNPFDQWDDWYAWDLAAGYHTSAYLGRVVHSSYELSEADQSLAIDDAMNEIIIDDPLGIYIKVKGKSS